MKNPPLLICLVAILSAAGCGYSTKSTLPSNLRTIYVEPFKNSINYTDETVRNVYLPLLEVNARNAVISRFQFNGALKIAPVESADLILKGNLVGFSRSALRYTDDEDIEEYRIYISVTFELFNQNTGKTDWVEPGFSGDASYFLTGPDATSEESAINEALVDLARRIVERTVEDW